MPGANCSIFGCTKSRTTKGLAIFGIPEKDDEWLTTKQQKFSHIKTGTLKGKSKRFMLESFHLCLENVFDYFYHDVLTMSLGMTRYTHEVLN